MTPEQFRRLGEALYGPRWQTAMADDLGIASRTVRRYAAGQPVSPAVADALYRLIGARVTVSLGRVVSEIWG